MKRVVYVLALLHSTPEQLHDKRSPPKKFTVIMTLYQVKSPTFCPKSQVQNLPKSMGWVVLAFCPK